MRYDLKRNLDEIAENLRGFMTVEDFSDFMLGLLFYKYESDYLEFRIQDVPDNRTSPAFSESESPGVANPESRHQ